MATAKKATASKVAAKKAPTKRPAARLTAPPKDVVEAAAPNASTGRTIEFHGRTILVEMPDENQITVWRKIVRQLQEEINTKDPERVFVLLDRGRRIVDSVIALEVDREWLDEMLLDRKITLKDTVEIIVLATRAYNPEGYKLDGIVNVAEIE